MTLSLEYGKILFNNYKKVHMINLVCSGARLTWAGISVFGRIDSIRDAADRIIIIAALIFLARSAAPGLKTLYNRLKPSSNSLLPPLWIPTPEQQSILPYLQATHASENLHAIRDSKTGVSYQIPVGVLRNIFERTDSSWVYLFPNQKSFRETYKSENFYVRLVELVGNQNRALKIVNTLSSESLDALKTHFFGFIHLELSKLLVFAMVENGRITLHTKLFFRGDRMAERKISFSLEELDSGAMHSLRVVSRCTDKDTHSESSPQTSFPQTFESLVENYRL